VRNGKSSGADKRSGWLDQLRGEEKRLVEERLPRLQKDSAPIHPLRLAHEINQALTDNTMYIGDGGDVVTFSGGVVQPHGPGLWMDPGPLGTIGVGMPFVLGAKQARPDREIIGLFGDGSFSLTGWDFETAIRYDLPFIGIIGNNSYMNQIRYGQIAKYGEEMGDVGVKLGDVKYDEFAKMLGGYGEEVREPKDIRPAIERARESGKPSLINVWIDPNAFAPGTMNQTMYK
jgi:acetolactate synthase-1/2/3 large subunit